MQRKILKGLRCSTVGMALLCGAWAAGASEAAVASAAEGADLLRRAFALRYDCDTRARVRLEMHDGRGGLRSRELYLVTKYQEGRMRSVGRLLSPEHLRGMTLLSIEALGRVDDVFVYLPSLRKSRRISRSRRGDSFLGSDVIYRDFERHRADDYSVVSVEPEEGKGERALRLVTQPKRDALHDRIDFVLAERDLAVLGVVYFREGRIDRRVSIDRDAILSSGGRLVPTRFRVERVPRKTATIVTFFDLEIDPEIDDRIFSVITLDAERSLGGRDAVGQSGRERASPD